MTGECRYEAVIQLDAAVYPFPRPVVSGHLFTPKPTKRPNKSLAVAFPIDTPKRLEMPVIHREQNSDPISNRYKIAPPTDSRHRCTRSAGILPAIFRPATDSKIRQQYCEACSAGPGFVRHRGARRIARTQIDRRILLNISRHTKLLETLLNPTKNTTEPPISRHKIGGAPDAI